MKPLFGDAPDVQGAKVVKSRWHNPGERVEPMIPSRGLRWYADGWTPPAPSPRITVSLMNRDRTVTETVFDCIPEVYVKLEAGPSGMMERRWTLREGGAHPIYVEQTPQRPRFPAPLRREKKLTRIGSEGR